MPTSAKTKANIKPTEIMRAVAVHLYVQFRLRGHGKGPVNKPQPTRTKLRSEPDASRRSLLHSSRPGNQSS
ncbi:hypothetical protein BCR44DRAFT_1455494 [Catenaria anguillulae PL171]|uniref:Uncharacterized protein n=1 Tax=Catenaria anguillulae PL171 TaxID=765915 RepID=A0A1Y2GZ36_9FUNG|nr:hypothetical protein BCR44DRAFT_1455494 [Catenaria anguillulae PL171]